MQTLILVIVSVASIACISLGGIIALSIGGSDIPDILEITCVSSVTGLIGMLVPTEKGQSK